MMRNTRSGANSMPVIRLYSKYHKQTKAAKHQTSAKPKTTTGSGVVTGQASAEPKLLAVHPATKKPAPRLKDARSTREVKQAILQQVSAGGKLKAKHHLQSLLFGLSMGLAVLFIFLFSFFNEFFIAPFIQPSRNASATPLSSVPTASRPPARPRSSFPR